MIDAATPPCRFRRAAAADHFILDAWLPADRGRGVSFIGTLPTCPNTPVAAFAVAPPIERHTPPGLALALHVPPAFRDRGIEQQIVRLAERMAATNDVGPLHAWPHPPAGSEAATVFEALGFTPFDEFTTWRVRSRQALGRIAGLGEKAAAAVPAGVHVAPLDAADPMEVLALWEAELAEQGALRDDALRRIRGEGPDGFGSFSRVLLVNGALRGILLAQSRRQTFADIVAFAVHPDFRRGWAPIHLVTRALRDADPGEQDLFQFSALRRHVATHRLARLFDAEVVLKRLMMRRECGSDSVRAIAGPR